MTTRLAMRPLEERHVADDIDLMVWSVKMDLLALSYANGEVALHRLNWLKVWTLPPPQKNLTVKGIAWRPDGKVLAIGYSNRELLVVNVENKDIVMRNTFDGEITLVTWSQEKEVDYRMSYHDLEPPSAIFLPRLPCLSRGPKEEHKEDAKGMKDQKCLNVLFVGLSTGFLILIPFGVYPKISLDIKQMLNCSSCNILDAVMSNNLDSMCVSVFVDSTVYMLLLKTSILSQRDFELKNIALKYGQIYSCLDYLDLTLQSISEGWEDIMMEMESKLHVYASKVPFGRVSSDFLDLLVSGKPSQEMYDFLMDDLTEKGLKKLNHSVEINYVNTHGFVLKNLQAVGHNIAFQIDELCGLSRCPTYDHVLGLSEEDAMAAFRATGSFLVKATEVQQVISESVAKFKAFFRWLLATYLRVSDRSAFSKMSQQQHQHVVDFITNMEKNGKFHLDRLGQYLVDGDLEEPPTESNRWEKLISERVGLQSSSHIVPRHNNYSLIKEVKHLKSSIDAVFTRIEKSLVSHFQLQAVKSLQCSPGLNSSLLPKITHTYVLDEKKFFIAVLDPLNQKGYHFIEISESNALSWQQFVPHQHTLVDIQFYLPDTLSVLLRISDVGEESRNGTGFEQIIIRSISKQFTGMSSMDTYTSSSSSSSSSALRLIDGMAPDGFAVCGARKVAVVLFDTKRRVKIFEMEVEEEDDDEDEPMDTTNSSSTLNNITVNSMNTSSGL